MITQAGAKRSRMNCWAAAAKPWRAGDGGPGTVGPGRQDRTDRPEGDFDTRRPADADAAVDPPFFGNRLEQVDAVPDGFSRAQEEAPAFAQGEVEQGDDLPLDFRIQVNQEIAAGDEILPGKRRIGRQVVRGEDDPGPDVLHDLAATVTADKESLHPLGGDMAGDRLFRIGAGPGGREGVRIVVRGEDLKADLLAGGLDPLGQQDRQAVGFLARRAAWNPDPDFRPRRGLFDQGSDDLGVEYLPGFGLAEEFGHADQQVFLQQAGFLGIFLHEAGVFSERLDLVQGHPSLNPPLQRVGLVEIEIVPALGPEDVEDGPEVGGLHGRRRRFGGRIHGRSVPAFSRGRRLARCLASLRRWPPFVLLAHGTLPMIFIRGDVIRGEDVCQGSRVTPEKSRRREYPHGPRSVPGAGRFRRPLLSAEVLAARRKLRAPSFLSSLGARPGPREKRARSERRRRGIGGDSIVSPRKGR